MPRNTRPAWRGIGGRHAAESVAGIRRNTHLPNCAPTGHAIGITFGFPLHPLAPLVMAQHLARNLARTYLKFV